MNIEEKLKNARGKLGRIEASYNESLKTYEHEIRMRQGKGEVGPDIDNLVKWVAGWKFNSQKQLETLQAEVTELETQITSDEYKLQQRGRAALENMKSVARDGWLENGGSEEGFDQAWPEMEKDILKKRTLAGLEKAMKG